MTTTYDLGLFGGTQVLAGFSNSSGVTGPEKVSQRLATVLLTEKGTVPYDLDLGTEFITNLRAGNLRTELDVVMYFNQAAADAMMYMTSVLTGTEPSSEVIESITLDHFELNLPNLQLYINMLTKDGLSRTIVLPVSSLEVT